ncbi:MAG: DUF2723 domain-containing protein [candidate division Zixibacteria bacterium]|nr:DUF2723 domain-containing protein [candidate division Zixibacteria bacterium]
MYKSDVKLNYSPAAQRSTLLFAAFLLTIVVLTLNLSLLSSRFNGDGLGYARVVEDADSSKLFSISARLLFCPTGKLVHSIVGFVDSDIRSVHSLQILNSIFGALGVGVFFLAAFRISRSIRLSILAALGLGFSLSYWFWSTNATSYPGCIFFLIVTLYLLIKLTETSGRRRYLLLCLLIGLTHALANFFWLTALLAAPAIVLGIIVGYRGATIIGRIKAAITYSASLLLFLVIPLLVAGFATGRVDSLSGFPAWLTVASYGIPPDLSLLNLSKGIIGFSSSVFRIIELGPAIKQAVWGVPYVIENNLRLYVEMVVFVLLWVFLIAVAFYLVRYRKEVFRSKTRMAWVLAFWAIPPALFGLIWLGSDTERWLSVLLVLWLLILFIAIHAARFLSAARAKAIEIALWAFVAVIFAHNLVFAVIPDHDPDNNQYMQSAQYLNSRMSGSDLILLWGHDHVFTADHLTYFFGIEAHHLGRYAKKRPDEAFSTLDSDILNCRARGSRVFVSGRIFLYQDLPESHHSDANANTERAEFAEFFSKWKMTSAFTHGTDTYMEVFEE